jgi:hypothetical protein
MTNTVIIQRLSTLEREVRFIKLHMGRAAISATKEAEKLPRGLKIALREIDEGKEIGPFNTVEDFMVGLK